MVPAQVWCTCSPLASCQRHLPGPGPPRPPRKQQVDWHKPVEALVDFPAAPAQEQHTRQHHEGSPNKERHHHHHQHIVVQDGVRLRLWRTRGQVLPGLWWARPVHLLPHPLTHSGAACGIVPRRGQGGRGGGGGSHGHGGCGLHFEVRRTLGEGRCSAPALSTCLLTHPRESEQQPTKGSDSQGGGGTPHNSRPLRSVPSRDLHLPIFKMRSNASPAGGAGLAR